MHRLKQPNANPNARVCVDLWPVGSSRKRWTQRGFGDGATLPSAGHIELTLQLDLNTWFQGILKNSGMCKVTKGPDMFLYMKHFFWDYIS